MKKTEVATFAGGCFWCMVAPFAELPGVEKVVSGYTGGHKEKPTYEEVASKTTGHHEAVQITIRSNNLRSCLIYSGAKLIHHPGGSSLDWEPAIPLFLPQ